jgi:hypothetical protein
MNKILAAGLICVCILVGVIAYAAYQASQKISSTGTIFTVNVGVYKDAACTQNLTSIDWDGLWPGEVKNFTCYVKNTGSASEILSMTASNWQPSNATSFITLTWDKEGYNLAVAANVQAIFTLSVSPTITGIINFSFNITVTGTQSTGST